MNEWSDEVRKKEGEEFLYPHLKKYKAEIKNKNTSPDSSKINTLVKKEADYGDYSHQRSSYGTGFILNSSGYIITNHHIIRGSKSIDIRYLDGERTKAKIIAEDQGNDIAILKPIRTANIKILDLPIRDSSQVSLGDGVYTLGYPIPEILGDIVLLKGRVNSLSGVKKNRSVFLTNIPIQKGNSGAPVFNKDGEVIGLVGSFLDPTLTNAINPQNLSFVIKASYLKEMLFKVPEALIIPADLSLSANPDTQKKDFIRNVGNNIVLIQAE
tara:strand:- start:253 stop:1059 length:807 start_codon:yes stop_codon:yes gene_type:complete